VYYAFTFLFAPFMKKLQNFIIIIGVFLLSILNVNAQPLPPEPPQDEPAVVPIGDNIQYIVILAVVFGLFVIYKYLKKQNFLYK